MDTGTIRSNHKQTWPWARSSEYPKRGKVVIIGGPDGSGKTTLCERLIADVLGGDRVLHVRFPRLLPRRNRERARTRRLGAGNTPDASAPRIYPPSHIRGLTTVKASYLYIDFLLGWALRVAPHVRKGGWVVFERGWWDHAVDPRRYRLRSGRPFQVLGRFLPNSDLVFVLEADPDLIRARKPQLSAEELTRQMTAWHSVLPADQQVVFLDAASPVEDLVNEVRNHLGALESGVSRGNP
jgi:thymidylate kinase